MGTAGETATRSVVARIEPDARFRSLACVRISVITPTSTSSCRLALTSSKTNSTKLATRCGDSVASSNRPRQARKDREFHAARVKVRCRRVPLGSAR